VHATLTAKNAHARLCNSAATTLPCKLLQTILGLVQASCRLLFAARPPAVSTKSVARRCSLKKKSKSTLAHDAVADALLHKHHLIIYIGAGPIQLIYGSPLQLAAGRYLEKILFSTMFWGA